MPFSTSESSATIGTTERSLPADTTTGVPTSQTTEAYVMVFLDLNALAAGDQFELKYYEKVVSGGTQRLVETYTFTGAQGKPIACMPAVHLVNGWDITLKKITGTDRAIAWSLRYVTES